MVVFGFLDMVSPANGGISVIIVAFVRDEVDLAEELLLVMLEFSDHGGKLSLFPIRNPSVCRNKVVVVVAECRA